MRTESNIIFLTEFYPSLLTCRGGAGGGVAGGGRAILPGDRILIRGGHAPCSRGTAVYIDKAASHHGEEQGRQLQPNSEDKKPAANPRCARHLH